MADDASKLPEGKYFVYKRHKIITVLLNGKLITDKYYQLAEKMNCFCLKKK